MRGQKVEKKYINIPEFFLIEIILCPNYFFYNHKNVENSAVIVFCGYLSGGG